MVFIVFEHAKEVSMFTDADREKDRPYLIYVGNTLYRVVVCNLKCATEIWNSVCSEHPESTVTLYSDRRAKSEICCEQTAEIFPRTRETLRKLAI